MAQTFHIRKKQDKTMKEDSAQKDLREGKGQSNIKCELSSASSMENWQ